MTDDEIAAAVQTVETVVQQDQCADGYHTHTWLTGIRAWCCTCGHQTPAPPPPDGVTFLRIHTAGRPDS